MSVQTNILANLTSNANPLASITFSSVTATSFTLNASLISTSLPNGYNADTVFQNVITVKDTLGNTLLTFKSDNLNWLNPNKPSQTGGITVSLGTTQLSTKYQQLTVAYSSINMTLTTSSTFVLPQGQILPDISTCTVIWDVFPQGSVSSTNVLTTTISSSTTYTMTLHPTFTTSELYSYTGTFSFSSTSATAMDFAFPIPISNFPDANNTTIAVQIALNDINYGANNPILEFDFSASYSNSASGALPIPFSSVEASTAVLYGWPVTISGGTFFLIAGDGIYRLYVQGIVTAPFPATPIPLLQPSTSISGTAIITFPNLS